MPVPTKEAKLSELCLLQWFAWQYLQKYENNTSKTTKCHTN